MKKMGRKIFFIHVAKTAGSSVNRFLDRHLKGEIHCERYLEWSEQKFSNVEYLSGLDYISGHQKIFSFFNSGFDRNSYFLCTLLRDPFAQLLSHVNWIIHIYDIGPKFFSNHPELIQNVSLNLRKARLDEFEEFKALMFKYRGLFQNNQSRYFMIDDSILVNDANGNVKASAEEVIESMKSLDFVGVTEFYEKSLELMLVKAGYDLPIQVEVANKNVHYGLGKDILEKPEFKDFLLEYNAVDIALYRFWRTEFETLWIG